MGSFQIMANDGRLVICSRGEIQHKAEESEANARLIMSAPVLLAERNRLRAALVQLVGVDGPAELAEMEAVMRLMPAPAEDKAATIDAIHALIATLPTETVEAK